MSDLRRLAEAAPVGPWMFTGDVESMGLTIASDPYELDDPTHKYGAWEAAGIYIAAASPDVILALLDRAEQAESAVERLRVALDFTAIPTLLVFAKDNAGVREAIEWLRAALTDTGDGT